MRDSTFNSRFQAVVAWAEKNIVGVTKETALEMLTGRLMKAGW